MLFNSNKYYAIPQGGAVGALVTIIHLSNAIGAMRCDKVLSDWCINYCIVVFYVEIVTAVSRSHIGPSVES